MPLISAKSLFSDDKRDDTSDDRVFAAKRNQFLVHAFAAPDDDANDAFDALTAALAPRFPDVTFTAREDRHVSLLNGFHVLRFHQIDAFCRSLDRALLPVRAPAVCLDSLEVFAREDGSRHFVVATEREPRSQRLLSAFEQSLREFQNSSIDDSIRNHFRIHVTLGQTQSEKRARKACAAAHIEGAVVWRARHLSVKMGNICREFELK